MRKLNVCDDEQAGKPTQEEHIKNTIMQSDKNDEADIQRLRSEIRQLKEQVAELNTAIRDSNYAFNDFKSKIRSSFNSIINVVRPGLVAKYCLGHSDTDERYMDRISAFFSEIKTILKGSLSCYNCRHSDSVLGTTCKDCCEYSKWQAK